MKKNNVLKVIFVALIFAAAGIIYSCSAGKNSSAPVKGDGIISYSADSSFEESMAGQTLSEETLSRETDSRKLCVYVSGAVTDPGVYYLDEGARVYEAVEMAGGVTQAALKEAVNMAAPVSDGQQIFIPKEGESFSTDLVQNEGDGKVNINTARADELITLPGIGKARAEQIIKYREENGGFASIEDIKKVSGIKEASFEKLKDYIKV